MPKHATVVAYLALFTTLGGTAYAATGGNFVLGHSNHASTTTSLKNSGSGPALKLGSGKTTAPLAVSNGTKVKHLNADSLDGLSSGAFARKTTSLTAEATSPDNAPAVTLGPWSFELNCQSGSSTVFKITGPGEVGGSISLATGGNAATTVVHPMGSIGVGYTVSDNTGQQTSLALFLRSGTTVAEVHLLVTAANGGLFEECNVVGSAALISA